MGRRIAGQGRRIAAQVVVAGVFARALGLGVGSAGADDLCAAAADPPVRIAAITEAFDVRLEDGRTLRLAGLDLPPPGAADPDDTASARRRLEAWAKAARVTVHLLSAMPDRWGRLPALLWRPGAVEPSAAVLLLDAGLARARPDPAVHPCFAALLAAEDRARAGRRGIWAEPGTGAIRPDDADALGRASGGFALVEGILGVHAGRGGTLYLTLGRDRWGFAAVLTRRDAARLAKAGLDVADYAGTPVRLRGDLDDRFGPRMPFTDPDQFQSLEPGTLAAEPARSR